MSNTKNNQSQQNPLFSDQGQKVSQMKSLESLKEKLTPEQFHVTQQCGTEPPFKNAYWDNHEAGLYVDVVSGDPLFISMDKFDSGTGWPSFTRPLEIDSITQHIDNSIPSLFGPRIEVKSKSSGSHLGHVFDDGPADQGGKRYCINSAALRFIPASRLKEEGYEKYLVLFKDKK